MLKVRFPKFLMLDNYVLTLVVDIGIVAQV